MNNKGLSLLLICALLLILKTSVLGQDAYNVTPDDKVSELINDSAKLGVLIIDLGVNLVGIGWTDRDKSGIGRVKLLNEISGISSKYGLDLKNSKGNVSLGIAGGGASGKAVYVNLHKEWKKLLPCQTKGECRWFSSEMGVSFFGIAICKFY